MRRLSDALSSILTAAVFPQTAAVSYPKPGLLSLALYSGDGNNAYDILSGASTGQIVDRFCDTLGNRAISLCLCQSLGQFVTDVSSIQIREDQDVGFTCYGAARSLACAYARNDCRVKLELAVQFEVRIRLLLQSW